MYMQLSFETITLIAIKFKRNIKRLQHLIECVFYYYQFNINQN